MLSADGADTLGAQLLTAVKKRKVKRLFIDGLDGFEQATPDRARVPSFFTALSELRALGVTTVFTAEMRTAIGLEVQMPVARASAVADNIVLLHGLQSGARLHRLLSIRKIRDSEFDLSMHEFAITAQGIRLAGTSESAEILLGRNGAGRGEAGP